MSIQVVVSEPGKCPSCGKLIDLDSDNCGNVGFQDLHIFVDWECPSCNFEWTDWHVYENSTYTDTVLNDGE